MAVSYFLYSKHAVNHTKTFRPGSPTAACHCGVEREARWEKAAQCCSLKGSEHDDAWVYWPGWTARGCEDRLCGFHAIADPEKHKPLSALFVLL